MVTYKKKKTPISPTSDYRGLQQEDDGGNDTQRRPIAKCGTEQPRQPHNVTITVENTTLWIHVRSFAENFKAADTG